jgi:hypothetical protein
MARMELGRARSIAGAIPFGIGNISLVGAELIGNYQRDTELSLAGAAVQDQAFQARQMATENRIQITSAARVATTTIGPQREIQAVREDTSRQLRELRINTQREGDIADILANQQKNEIRVRPRTSGHFYSGTMLEKLFIDPDYSTIDADLQRGRKRRTEQEAETQADIKRTEAARIQDVQTDLYNRQQTIRGALDLEQAVTARLADAYGPGGRDVARSARIMQITGEAELQAQGYIRNVGLGDERFGFAKRARQIGINQLGAYQADYIQNQLQGVNINPYLTNFNPSEATSPENVFNQIQAGMGQLQAAGAMGPGVSSITGGVGGAAGAGGRPSVTQSAAQAYRDREARMAAIDVKERARMQAIIADPDKTLLGFSRKQTLEHASGIEASGGDPSLRKFGGQGAERWSPSGEKVLSDTSGKPEGKDTNLLGQILEVLKNGVAILAGD